LNQKKRESLHPDESQNCKNQSCSSNYMPSNAASKSLYIFELQTRRHLSGRPIFELRSVDQRSVSQSDHIIWEMNIPNVCSDKTYRSPYWSHVFERQILHWKTRDTTVCAYKFPWKTRKILVYNRTFWKVEWDH